MRWCRFASASAREGTEVRKSFFGSNFWWISVWACGSVWAFCTCQDVDLASKAVDVDAVCPCWYGNGSVWGSSIISSCVGVAPASSLTGVPPRVSALAEGLSTVTLGHGRIDGKPKLKPFSPEFPWSKLSILQSRVELREEQGSTFSFAILDCKGVGSTHPWEVGSLANGTLDGVGNTLGIVWVSAVRGGGDCLSEIGVVVVFAAGLFSKDDRPGRKN